MQRPEIFTRDVGLEKNDRLETMHTSDRRRSVCARSFIKKKKKEDDDENSDFAYERFLV